MPSKRDQRKVFQEQRLRHQLEVQSRQIEKVFTRHQMPARVAGGMVRPRSISFDLQAQLSTSLDRLREITQELIAALGVADVHVSREDGHLRLHITKADDPAVSLFDLLSILPDLPTATAVLGLAEDGRPVLLDFSQEDVTHVLLTGVPTAGKTTLLRTLAVSLALTNRQSQTQLIIIDLETAERPPAYTELEPLNYLPHLLTNVIYDLESAASGLNFLVDEMEYRCQQGVKTPTIIVLIDKIATLLEMGGQPVEDAVVRLAQRGASEGIHLVLSTQRSGAPILDNLLKANLPVRIVGQVAGEEEAKAATGLINTQAEFLLGQGDFLAISGDTLTHFQAAYIGDYDLHLSLEALQRNRPRALLAQPVNIRTTLPPGAEQPHLPAAEPQQFSFDGESVSLENEDKTQELDDEL